jgi:hypothetical protein
MSAPTPPPPKRETLFEPRFLSPAVLILPVILMPTGILLAAVFTNKLNGPAPLIMIGLTVCSILGVTGFWLHKIHNVRTLIRTHGRFLCLNCHYPLTGLADQGRCPECDYPFDRPTNERRWKSWEEGVNKGKPLA